MTPGAEVEVVVKLRFWDIYSSSIFLTKRQHLRFFLVWIFLAGLCGLFARFANTHSADHRVWKQILLDCSPLAVIFPIQLILLFGLPIFVAMRSAKSEIVRAGYRYTFSDAGLAIATVAKKVDVGWPAVIEAQERSAAFLIRTGRLRAYTIPLRCFSSDADVNAVRGLLRAKVPKANLRSG